MVADEVTLLLPHCCSPPSLPGENSVPTTPLSFCGGNDDSLVPNVMSLGLGTECHVPQCNRRNLNRDVPPRITVAVIAVTIALMTMIATHRSHLYGGGIPLAADLASPFPLDTMGDITKGDGDGNEDPQFVLPRMIVFDLDLTLWSPEMWELDRCPSVPVVGLLVGVNGKEGEGVVGMMVPPSGPTVRILNGALEVLQMLYTDPLLGVNGNNVIYAAASTSEEPSFSEACLDGLEIFPGVPLRRMFRYTEIGRTGRLTSIKETHFRALHDESGIPYDEMLFFDDCFWSDNVGEVYDSLGVIGERTPDGLTMEHFRDGLKRFKEVRIERHAAG